MLREAPKLRAPKVTAGHGDEDDTLTRSRKPSWARLLRKGLELDPLVCARCRSGLKIVAVLTDPRSADRNLWHLESGVGHDLFESRAPRPADTSAT